MTVTNIPNLDYWKGVDKRKLAISVCSGGMDSVSMGLAMLKKNYDVIFCHVNLGQKSEKQELEAVEAVVSSLIRSGWNGQLRPRAYYWAVDTPWIGEMGGSSLTSDKLEVPEGMDSIKESFKIGGNLDTPGLWTPGRNIVLLAAAASLADRTHASVVTLGANQSETAYRDNTMDFLKSFELMARFGTLVMPEFTAPLYDLDKAEILLWGIEAGFYGIYKYTWSCDNGEKHMCGRCGCCNNRRLAFFILNNIMGYEGDADNQTYMDPDYFGEVFLPSAIENYQPGMWYGPYIEDLKRLVKVEQS